MNLQSSLLIVAAGAALTLLSGCPEPHSRINAPPQGEAENKHPMGDNFAYMTDQALMQDRCICDIHFIPHTSELSGVGQARLARYAELLATRGGTIAYDPQITDQKLIDDRLASASRYLACSVPGTAHIDVVVGLPGGRGMDAPEAMNRRKQMLARSPTETGSSSSSGGMGSSSSNSSPSLFGGN